MSCTLNMSYLTPSTRPISHPQLVLSHTLNSSYLTPSTRPIMHPQHTPSHTPNTAYHILSHTLSTQSITHPLCDSHTTLTLSTPCPHPLLTITFDPTLPHPSHSPLSPYPHPLPLPYPHPTPSTSPSISPGATGGLDQGPAVPPHAPESGRERESDYIPETNARPNCTGKESGTRGWLSLCITMGLWMWSMTMAKEISNYRQVTPPPTPILPPPLDQSLGPI